MTFLIITAERLHLSLSTGCGKHCMWLKQKQNVLVSPTLLACFLVVSCDCELIAPLSIRGFQQEGSEVHGTEETPTEWTGDQTTINQKLCGAWGLSPLPSVSLISYLQHVDIYLVFDSLLWWDCATLSQWTERASSFRKFKLCVTYSMFWDQEEGDVSG